MINKLAKYKKQEIEDFSVPQRIYSNHELQDFHKKIQKFWDEPREVRGEVFGIKLEGTAQKFRHQDLHVAYGAARKVQHGKTHVYQYNAERYEQFENLWKQYESWRQKQDWIENKQNEELEKTAEQIPF